MATYAPGTPGNGGPNAQADTTTGTPLGTPLNSPPPLINSWNLSPWTSGNGAFTQAPTLTVNGVGFNSTNPQDYISKLQEIQSQGASGPVSQFIQQLQSAFPGSPTPAAKAAPANSAAPTATPAPVATPAPTPSTPTAQVNAPTVALQPGSTDSASVNALQDYLVAHGYMTAAQKATGPGIYGPQTTAAVLAMQKNLGIDYSSGPGDFGPITIAALTNSHNATAPVTPTTPAPVTPGTPVPATTPAPVTPAATTPGATIPTAAPTVALQPGATGDNVKALQDYLVSQGLMTQDQVNTGYGTYGPQTEAAVLALQQKLGVDNSTGPGFYGPKTIAAVQAAVQSTTPANPNTNPSGVTENPAPTTTPSVLGASTTPPDPYAGTPYAGMNPVQAQVQMYTDTASQLGLPTIKSQYDAVIKQQGDLTNKMNDEIANVQNNPWLAQGIVDKEVQNIKNKYATQLDTLTHLETLYDSMYKQGQATVESIVTKADANITATNALAQKQIDAATALAKDNVVQSVGGRELLINKETGKTVADLGPTTPSSTNGSFNLAPGDTRFDASGKVIASLPAKPTSDSIAAQNQRQQDDIASAVLDFQNRMKTLNQAGANPDAYNYYKTQLSKTYGASAALALDAAMKTAGITVDYGK